MVKAKRPLAVVLALLMVFSAFFAVGTVSVSAASGDIIYFEKPNNWDTVNCYVWSGSSGEAKGWPGTAMTLVSGNVYSYTMPGDQTKVIFNNGSGDQTGDSVASYDGTKNYFTPSSNRDDQGRLLGTWSVYEGPTNPTSATQPTSATSVTDPTVPATDPTTPVTEPDKLTVNGTAYGLGDTITYTTTLQNSAALSTIGGHVSLTGSTGSLTLLTSSQSEACPNLTNGNVVVNFAPNDGSNNVYFNALDASTGYNFSTAKTLVTLEYEVTAVGGSVKISTIIDEIYDLNKNIVTGAKTSTSISSTSTPTTTDPTTPTTTDPTTPTTTDPTTPTTTDPTKPTATDPTVASGVVINGTKYHKGDVIQITVKHQADTILSGISGLIKYDSSYLKLAGEYTTNDAAFSPKLSASGSFMVNRNYETAGTVISLSYSAMNAGTGYNFKTEDTLAVAQFEVIAESGTTSLTHAVLEQYDMDLNDYTGKTSYTVTLVSSEPTTTDPTTPTTPPTTPTATDPTTPTTTDPTKPTATDPTVASGVVINGTKYHKGDVIQITVKHQADTILSGISGLIKYDSSYLKLAGEYTTNDAVFSPKLSASGSFMVNRNYETTGTVISLSYSAMNAGTGYNFKTEDTLAVAQFEVIAESGTTSLTHAVLEQYDMDLNDYTGKTSYTVTLVSSEPTTTDPTTPTTPPTTPTATDPTTPTTTDPTKPTATDPTVASGVVINGTKYHKGDVIQITVKHQADVILSGISGLIKYDSSYLKLAGEYTTNDAVFSPKLSASGSFMVNRNYETTGTVISLSYSAMNAGTGYNFKTEDTLSVAQFEVIAESGTTSLTHAVLEQYDMDLNDYTGKTSYTVTLVSSEPTTTDPTTPTTPTTPPTTPTTPPTTPPTDPTTPTATDPTTPVTEPEKLTVNGTAYSLGDTIKYTTTLQNSAVLSAIGGRVSLTGSTGSLTLLTSSKSAACPNLTNGNVVVNFAPNDGSKAVYFNALDASTGYNFSTAKTLVTLEYKVTAVGGSVNISTIIDEIYDLNKNIVTGAKTSTSISSTSTPTTPTPTDPTTPTVTDPTVASGVVINGTKYHKGDVIQITVKHQADKILSGISGLIKYDSSYLKLAGEYTTNDAAFSPKLSASGSFMVNRNYETAGTVISLSYSAMNAGTGYNFNKEDTLAVAQFEVIAESGTTSLTHAVLEQYDMDLNDYTGKTSYTVTLVSSEPTTTDPTTPTTTDPTDPTTTDPTDPTTTDPTAPALCVIINGETFNQGDVVEYDLYMKSADIIGGVAFKTIYDSSYVELSDVQFDTADKYPVIHKGGSLLEATATMDGTLKTSKANAMASISGSGYDFRADDTVLVRLKFDVIAANGTTTIYSNISEAYVFSNQSGSDIFDAEFTQHDIVKLYQGAEPSLTVNGQAVNKGDQVVFEANLSASDVLSYIDATVNYTSGILEMSKISTSVDKGVLTNVKTGANVDLKSVSGAAALTCSNASGYDFTSEKVFVKLVFNVIADNGAATISTTYNSVKSISGAAVSPKTNTSSIKVIADGAKDDVFLGDINGDAKINVLDAIQIQKHVVSMVTLSATQQIAADVNFDGSINVLDAILIQKIVVDMTTLNYPSRY